MRVVCSLFLAVLVTANGAEAPEAAEAEVCEAPRLWASLLEDWATGAGEQSARQGRVMSLPPTKGYYVTERIDGPLMPPPPPPHGPRPHGPPGSYGPAVPQGPAGPHGPQGSYSQYDEWRGSPPPPGGSKIVNRPPKPYKDKYKPTYPQASAGHGQPIPVDRVDAAASPPGKQVSETDLYLLTAIEKLVFRADGMEKRLRRLEESVHLLLTKDHRPTTPAPATTSTTKPPPPPQASPCPSSFQPLGGGCFHVAQHPADWKEASSRCRRLRARLLEPAYQSASARMLEALKGDRVLRDVEFWTGGLNPGLLWIWAQSARPLAVNGSTPAVAGDGRCLSTALDAATGAFAFRGRDCAASLRFICEPLEDEDRLSNEIVRVARLLRGHHPLPGLEALQPHHLDSTDLSGDDNP